MDEALNHEYLATKALELGAGTVLDFGCGKAHVVQLLRSRGVDAYGADVFWGGMEWGADGPFRELMREGLVRQIVDGRLPFEDGTFDVIVSDQVFEHVENFPQAAAEMVRVLKPTGRMYHQFPPKNILLEPHSKIPLAHRIPLRLRAPYMTACRQIGLGGLHPLHIEGAKAKAAWHSQWIEDYCVYRSRETIETIFRDYGFDIVHREAENCSFRAQERPVIRGAIRLFPQLAGVAFRALGCDCIELSSRRPRVDGPGDARAAAA